MYYIGNQALPNVLHRNASSLEKEPLMIPLDLRFPGAQEICSYQKVGVLVVHSLLSWWRSIVRPSCCWEMTPEFLAVLLTSSGGLGRSRRLKDGIHVWSGKRLKIVMVHVLVGPKRHGIVDGIIFAERLVSVR